MKTLNESLPEPAFSMLGKIAALLEREKWCCDVVNDTATFDSLIEPHLLAIGKVIIWDNIGELSLGEGFDMFSGKEDIPSHPEADRLFKEWVESLGYRWESVVERMQYQPK